MYSKLRPFGTRHERPRSNEILYPRWSGTGLIHERETYYNLNVKRDGHTNCGEAKPWGDEIASVEIVMAPAYG